MTRVLLVTQTTRSLGEFRRPWVHRLYRAYAAQHRRMVNAALDRLGPGHDVTVVGARELLDPSLGDRARVRYYDGESFKVDDDEVARLVEHLTTAWWPARDEAPELVHHGVWLPGLLAVQLAIVLRFEVIEPLGTLRRVCAEERPKRLMVLSGASIHERLAVALARRDGIPVGTAFPRAVWPRVYAAAYRALFPREERLRLRTFVRFPRRPVEPGSPPAGERLLFVTCRPRHHFVVDPVVAAAREAGHEAAVVAVSVDAPELARQLDRLRDAGVPTYRVTDFVPTREARGIVRRHRPRFQRLWRRMTASGALDAAVQWDGLALGPIVRPFLRDAVRTTLLTAVLTQEATARALDVLGATAVVVTSNRRFPERAAALAARDRRLPCVLFSNTLLLNRDASNSFDIGDRLLVIGAHVEAGLVERGVARDRIAVVGDPRSNAARLTSRTALRREVCDAFGFDAGRPIAVLVSKYVSLHFSPDEKAALYRTVFGAADVLGALQVVVKIHPNEDPTLLRQQIRSWGWPDAVLTQEHDIHRLFRAADVAIMVTSMAGLEAMALGCPVVAVQTGGKDFEGAGMPAYVTGGAVERVDMGDAVGLAGVLKRLFDDPATRDALVARGQAFAAPYVQPADGRLVERLVEVLEDIRSEQAHR